MFVICCLWYSSLFYLYASLNSIYPSKGHFTHDIQGVHIWLSNNVFVKYLKEFYKWQKCINITGRLNRVWCKVAFRILKEGNESTSAINWNTTSKKVLPQLSLIFRKTQNLVTMFKRVDCSKTGLVLFI